MEYSSSGESGKGCELSENTSPELNAAGTQSDNPDSATDRGDQSVKQEPSKPRSESN